MARPWRKKDVEYLKANWGKSNDELAEALGRTKSAVISKAYRLGL